VKPQNFFSELKRRTISMMDSADVKFEIGNAVRPIAHGKRIG